jgi:alkylhydroperoxidase/carboxymuconolactone decarboxylase family protein YurZ
LFVTNQIFGRTWSRGILSHQQLSLLNLGMLAGKSCMEEFELHFRVALKVTGVPLIQLREALLHIGMYCGIPTARECFIIARRVLKEESIDPSVLDNDETA